jgi:hypothetical protein
MASCNIYDMRVFVLSILSIIGWLCFTVSFAVLLNDYSTTVFGGSKDINALTFVHFALACLGWLVNVFSIIFSIMKGKNNYLGTVCVFCTALMLIIAGGVANDYGRIFYTLTLGGKISSDHLVPDALKAGMAGVCIFTGMEVFKLMCFFHRRTNGARSLPSSTHQ